MFLLHYSNTNLASYGFVSLIFAFIFEIFKNSKKIQNGQKI